VKRVIIIAAYILVSGTIGNANESDGQDAVAFPEQDNVIQSVEARQLGSGPFDPGTCYVHPDCFGPSEHADQRRNCLLGYRSFRADQFGSICENVR